VNLIGKDKYKLKWKDNKRYSNLEPESNQK
jgi:hypothetical protein